MSNDCICSASLQDLGVSQCNDLTKILARLIIVPELDRAGDKNLFATEDLVTKSALQAKFDSAYIEDRFFPLPKMENVENLRADPKYWTANNDRKIKVSDGVRTITMFITQEDGASHILLGKLQALSCLKNGFYGVDKNENFIYLTDSLTGLKIQPILFEAFDAQMVEGTDSDPLLIKVTFDYRTNVKDKHLRYLSAESRDFEGLDTNDVYSLLDVYSAYSNIIVTGFTVTLTEKNTGGNLAIKGLLVGDFTLYNNSTSAPVVVTSATESADGVYDLEFALQVVGNILCLTPSKAKYDFSAVVSNLITIP